MRISKSKYKKINGFRILFKNSDVEKLYVAIAKNKLENAHLATAACNFSISEL